jgi:hypothetical protein
VGWIMKKRLVANVACTALLGLCAPMLTVSGHAEVSDYRFAASKSKKVAVLIAGGSNWCRDQLEMRAVIENGSPLINEKASQAAFVNQLGPLLADSCPQAQQATLTIVQPDGPADSYTASASRGWVFEIQSTAQQVSDAGDPTDSPTETTSAAVDDAPATPAPAEATSQEASVSPETPVVPAPNVPTSDQLAASASEAGSPALAMMGSAADPASASTLDTKIANIEGLTDDQILILVYLKHNPEVAALDSTAHFWARSRFSKEYEENDANEFSIQPIIDKARQDLLDRLSGLPDTLAVDLTIAVELGTYDKAGQSFPLSIRGIDLEESYNVRCTLGVPDYFDINLANAPVVERLPMDAGSAQALIQKITDDYGSTDRDLLIRARATISDSSELRMTYDNLTNRNLQEDIANDERYCPNITVGFEIASGRLVTRGEKAKRLFDFTPAYVGQQTAAIKQAEMQRLEAERQQEAQRLEAERQKEARRQEAERQQQEAAKQREIAARREAAHAQIEATMKEFGALSPRARRGLLLAMSDTDNPQTVDDPLLPHRFALSTMAEMIVQAKLTEESASGNVMVQIGDVDGGEASIVWPRPAKLQIAGADVAVEEGWAIVTGMIEPSDLAEAEPTIIAEHIHACTQELCSEADDPSPFKAHLDRFLGLENTSGDQQKGVDLP